LSCCHETENRVIFIAGVLAVLVGVEHLEAAFVHGIALGLLLGDDSFFLGVGLFMESVEGGHLKFLVIGAAGGPAGKEEVAVCDGGGSAAAGRDAGERPFLRAGFQVIGDHAG